MDRSPFAPDPLGAVMLRAMANDLAWWGTVQFTPGLSVDRYLVDFYYRGVPYSPSEWFGDMDGGQQHLRPGLAPETPQGKIPRISRLMALAIHCDELL